MKLPTGWIASCDITSEISHEELQSLSGILEARVW